MSTIQHHAICHVGSVRTTNEDAILSYADAGLWAVADGMGGHEAGDYASQCLIDHLSRACDKYKGNYLVERIRQIITNAHLSIFEHSQQMAGKPLIGSTIVVLALEADNFHCFWSGDSRCYLLRDNTLNALTNDHTEAEAMLAEGGSPETLSDEEKIRAENTLVHAIGIDNEPPHVDYVSGYIYEGDRFLLCSDGINKIFTDEDINSRIAQNNIGEINQSFLDDALSSHAPDNLSSIIISVG
ncbi:MAG: PP2C family protein-serine/threonine phosphatase [Cellvibrionaceae bacterium]